MNPQDFTQIKRKIQDSSMLSDREKQEWLFLLPRMSAEELKELDRILSIRVPANHVGAFGSPFSRDPGTLPPQPRQQVEREPMPSFDLRPRGTRRPEFASPTAMPSSALTRIARLTAEDIRKPPSIYICLEAVNKEIAEILDKTDIKPKQIVEAFMQSPLYRDYLRYGVSVINKNDKAGLTLEEFEAVADFHLHLKDLGK